MSISDAQIDAATKVVDARLLELIQAKVPWPMTDEAMSAFKSADGVATLRDIVKAALEAALTH